LWAQIGSRLPPPSDAISTKEVQLPKGGPRLKIYTPKAFASRQRLPIGLYIHSGGLIAGAIEQEDHIARDIAERASIIIISTSYRLAPEHPFPAGLDDCVTSYKWIKQNAVSLGALPDKMVIMGASSGANLAVATTLRVLKEPGLKPNGLIAACAPTIHPDAIPDELKSLWRPERYKDSAMLTRDVIKTCSDAYGAPAEEPLCSVLLHPDLKDLPATYLVGCTKDPTFDDMMMLYSKLNQAGVPVQFEVAHGFPHFFWMLPTLQRSQELMDNWTVRLKEMICDP